MRAAVSGGAGFIGSNLVDRLVRDGADVLVLDDLSSGTEANISRALGLGARFAHTDVRDGDAVASAFEDFRPDTVFHLAAQIDVRVSMSRPAQDAAINVVGSLNVFSAAAAVGVRRVVNTSTGGAIYGPTAAIPSRETEPARPLSAYGLSKSTVEQYGDWFRQAHGLDVVTLRYGNVYGPRQNPGGDAGVVAILCDRALRGERPIVFGNGTQTRDFVFVGDIVAANIAAAGTDDLPHTTYNVGSGTETSVLDLVAAVARAAGLDPAAFAPEFHPARPGEVERSCLAVDRARAELGIGEPTLLDTGLRATLDWVRSVTADR